MKKLDTDQVLYLHNLMCNATGGSSGLRDRAVLESAIYHCYASFEGKDLYPTVEEKSARQAYGIIKNHPFIDGNKRTGLFVMLIFLELNNIKLNFTQSELVDLGIGIAKGKIDSEQLQNGFLIIKRVKVLAQMLAGQGSEISNLFLKELKKIFNLLSCLHKVETNTGLKYL